MLGQALENCFGAKLTIGPPVEGGFYYDSFVGSEVCTEKTWYPKLEGEIKKIRGERLREKQRVRKAKHTMLTLNNNSVDFFVVNPSNSWRTSVEEVSARLPCSISAALRTAVSEAALEDAGGRLPLTEELFVKMSAALSAVGTCGLP